MHAYEEHVNGNNVCVCVCMCECVFMCVSICVCAACDALNRFCEAQSSIWQKLLGWYDVAECIYFVTTTGISVSVCVFSSPTYHIYLVLYISYTRIIVRCGAARSRSFPVSWLYTRRCAH